MFTLHTYVRRITSFNLASLEWRRKTEVVSRMKSRERERKRENWGTSARNKQQKPRKANVQAVQMAENRWFLVKIELHCQRGYQAALNWTTIIISALAPFSTTAFPSTANFISVSPEIAAPTMQVKLIQLKLEKRGDKASWPHETCTCTSLNFEKMKKSSTTFINKLTKRITFLN